MEWSHSWLLCSGSILARFAWMVQFCRLQPFSFQAFVAATAGSLVPAASWPDSTGCGDSARLQPSRLQASVAAAAGSLAPAASCPDSPGCCDPAGSSLQDLKLLWQPQPTFWLQQHLKAPPFKISSFCGSRSWLFNSSSILARLA